MGIKDIFQKIKGFFNPNKKLPSAEQTYSDYSATGNSNPGNSNFEKDLEVISTKDLIFDYLKNEERVDQEILDGLMGDKLWYCIQESHLKYRGHILEKTYKAYYGNRDFARECLKGVKFENGNIIVTLRDKKEENEIDKEETIFSKNKITYRRMWGERKGWKQRQYSNSKEICFSSANEIDKVKCYEDDKILELDSLSDTLDIPPAEQILDAKETIIKDGIASYIDEDGNRKKIKIAENATGYDWEILDPCSGVTRDGILYEHKKQKENSNVEEQEKKSAIEEER